jgi:hypothetical protein
MDNATRLQTILVDSPVRAVLPAIAVLNLPNWWLAGSTVRNTVWRSLFGNDCQLVINDFDIFTKMSLPTAGLENDCEVNTENSLNFKYEFLVQIKKIEVGV